LLVVAFEAEDTVATTNKLPKRGGAPRLSTLAARM
jgi:hypothetical protein